jgi:hypothetical protein
MPSLRENITRFGDTLKISNYSQGYRYPIAGGLKRWGQGLQQVDALLA